ncbi:hypothetical protein D3C71_1137100 [compost metagenome]
MLQAFVDKRTLFDLLHPVDIVITPADDAYHRLAPHLFPVQIQCRYRQRSRGFHYNGIIVIQLKNGCTSLALRNHQHIIQYCRANLVGQITYTLHRSAVYELVDRLQRDDLLLLKRFTHGSSAKRFNPDDFGLRADHFDI